MVALDLRMFTDNGCKSSFRTLVSYVGKVTHVHGAQKKSGQSQQHSNQHGEGNIPVRITREH